MKKRKKTKKRSTKRSSASVFRDTGDNYARMDGEGEEWDLFGGSDGGEPSKFQLYKDVYVCLVSLVSNLLMPSLNPTGPLLLATSTTTSNNKFIPENGNSPRERQFFPSLLRPE